jgi:hypothetical protein
MVKLPRYQLEKMIRAKGIDPSVIDFKSMWDSSLTRKESFDIVRKEINLIAPEQPMFQKGQYSTRILSKSNRQTGRSNTRLDRKRTALPSGKRETWYGHVYYEHRKNRSDVKNRI